MTSATLTVTVRDLLTPELVAISDGMAAAARVRDEAIRRLDEFERELLRLRWEDEWAHLTGRPWAWKPRPPRVDVELDARWVVASRVEIDGAPLPCTGVWLDAQVVDRGRIRFEMPIDSNVAFSVHA